MEDRDEAPQSPDVKVDCHLAADWYGGIRAVVVRRAVEAQRAEEQKKQDFFVKRVDFAHIYVTPEGPPSNKPFLVLGDVTYSEPFTPDAINESKSRKS